MRFKGVIVRKIEIYKKDIRKESSGIVSRVANPSRVQEAKENKMSVCSFCLSSG